MKASLLRRAWQPLKRLASRAWGPKMVGGFVRGDGEFLPNTRVSNTLVVAARDRLMLADHVFIGHFSVLDATWGLSIGEGCQISVFTGIFTHSSHAAIRLYGARYVEVADKVAYFTAPVDIGAYSFVGAHATLLPGTRIGKGSVVAAYSKVRGTFEDFSVIAGNPARRVGDTRDRDAQLLQLHPDLLPSYEAWAGRDGLGGRERP